MGGLERYGHGGDLKTASETFGFKQELLLDFSANINPLGPPESVIQVITEQWGTMIHYPDPAQRGYLTALGRKLGVDLKWLLAGNGAAECMALAILAIAPKKVGVIYPSFSEYEQLSEQFGAEVIGIYGQEEWDYKPDGAELKSLFSKTDLVFIGHPNNPSGIVYSMDELIRMAEWTEETDTYLVVDEAFLDFLPVDQQATLLPILHQFPKCILIRSMTKFYAIPGLRLGFVIAHPSLIRAMKRKQVTWSVNQFALLAGETCLGEEDYEQRTRDFIFTERPYLQEEIQRRFGWKVWPGKANFLLIRLPVSMRTDELQGELGRKGILIRSCTMYEGLTPHDFRIAVRTREENERLLQAIGEITAKKEGRPWG